MPLYEYECESCGLQFEVRQKFSDKPVSECRECGGSVKKMISQTGFALKGGGWYQQGYSQPSSCSAEKSDACAGCPKAANG
ncbi:putative regulatory protein, FmdB family [Malonomonas rubra DSM 5091]|uniref:Putative regulatory protein, FmdB family n=1 Tax=Malonomonas rubra DSM 5091 TaxID=1122189 RepID=A0A1M6BDY5_MALRU|nr:zinc ribbon domain-containing protein [Malonomonas rubra]SHI46896.1 putative regulatory protein, FmdB family [Malonomonas rubra DSM 5091]